MDDYVGVYQNRTPKSLALYERARQVMPGGICHTPRFNKPYPLYVQKADGSKVWDVDGNEYVDLWMGHYALILGHNPAVTRPILEDCARWGTHWGIPNEFEVSYAEDLCRVIPGLEELRFCVTGTEATMYAVRLIRAFTGKEIVLKVRGGWHGGNTDLSIGVHAPMDTVDSGGLPAATAEYTKLIPFNDPEGVLQVVEQYRDRLAGVIIEPMGLAFIEPLPGFFDTVQSAVRKAGGLVILDEIVTGARLGLRGAQEYYGISPDLVTLGKILGGGMAIGVVGGRRDIMELCSPLAGLPKEKGVLVGGGTFSVMPPSMRAGRAVFNYLEQHEAEIYPDLARKGEYVRKGLADAFSEVGLGATVHGVGSLFSVQFPSSPDVALRNLEDVELKTDTGKRNNEFKTRMSNHGVFMVWGGGALSTAHTDHDLDRIIEAGHAAAKEMVRAEG